MTDPFDRGGPIRLSWQDRFQNKWPYMTTMMYQNDEGNNGLDTYRGHSVSTENVHRGPAGWPHPQPDNWTDNDKAGSDASSASSKKRKGCYRACNIALCAFLLITIVTAACAGVGLAILLNGSDSEVSHHEGADGEKRIDGFLSPEEEIYMSRKFCDLVKVLMKSTNYPIKKGLDHCYGVLKLIKGSEEMHLELHVLPAAKYSMKEKFRRALREQTLAEGSYRINGTDSCLKTSEGFPVEKCSGQSKHKLAKSPSAPTKVQTRLVSDETETEPIQPTSTVTVAIGVTDSSYTLVTATSGILYQSSGIVTTPPTSTSSDSVIPSLIPSSSFTFSSESRPSIEDLSSRLSDKPSASFVPPEHSPLSHVSSSSVMASAVSDSIVTSATIEEPRNHTYDVVPTRAVVDAVSSPASVNQIMPTTVSSTQPDSSDIAQSSSVRERSIIPSGVSSSSTAPSPSQIASSSQPISLQSSEFSHAYSSSLMIPASTPYLSTPLLPTSSSVMFSPQHLSTEVSITSAIPSIGMSPSSSLEQSTPSSKVQKARPFQTISKTAVQIAVMDNNLSERSDEATTKETSTKLSNRKPKVIENLMLGGVLKLPFKTTSRFRFLFADNSDRRAASPALNTIAGAGEHLKGPVTTTSSYKIITGNQKARIRFTSSGSGRLLTSSVNGNVKQPTSNALRSKTSSSQTVVSRIPIPPPIFSTNSKKSQALAHNTISSNELNGRANRFTMRS